MLWGNLLASSCACVFVSCTPSAPSACRPLPSSHRSRGGGRAAGGGGGAARAALVAMTTGLTTGTLILRAGGGGVDEAGRGVVVGVALLQSSGRRRDHPPGGYLANPAVGIQPRQITPSSVGVLFRLRPPRGRNPPNPPLRVGWIGLVKGSPRITLLVNYRKVGGLVRASEFLITESFVSSSPFPPVVLVTVTTHTTLTIDVTTTKSRGARQGRRSSRTTVRLRLNVQTSTVHLARPQTPTPHAVVRVKVTLIMKGTPTMAMTMRVRHPAGAVIRRRVAIAVAGGVSVGREVAR